MRSALVQVPTVIGHLRPLVLLPINALTGLSTDQLRGLLAHELAHVQRYDYLVNITQTIIETLLFYHPAVWWMGRVIRQERENACDDLAAEVCDRRTYAQALAAMESLRATPMPALGARDGVLLPRIRRILGLPTVARPSVDLVGGRPFFADCDIGDSVTHRVSEHARRRITAATTTRGRSP